MDISVSELSKERSLLLKLICGEKGLDNMISSPRIQKPGLLLTGVLGPLHSDRVQILGEAEIGYLSALDDVSLKGTLNILKTPSTPPVVVITRGIQAPKFLMDFSEENSVPIFSTPLTSSVLVEGIIKFLDDKLAPSVMLHGVLVDVLGIGILITGKSGIGKSECALDLISRGYRLVADDAVVIKRRYPATLFGMASDQIPYHLEVRGVGIVNIKDLFGITAIREKKQMDLMVELVTWDPKGEYERLGYDDATFDVLGVDVPLLKIPVSPGRSVATIVEVAARNQILKIMGYHQGREFLDKLDAELLSKGTKVLSPKAAPGKSKKAKVKAKK
ncbi:MAG: HPr(Ser) kinase/phosphatase [Deltaproteobacteria bacterium]|nr:HPr(Ser) kinase/phosphatase [Deltaproteobacteria bacterium]